MGGSCLNGQQVVEAVRASYRLSRMVGLLAWGWYLAVGPLRRATPMQRHSEVTRWAQHTLKAMGVQWRLEGVSPAQGPLLLVSNHVTWVDILVLLANFPCRFVAKAEVKAWPVIGTMAIAADTLFIERESKRDVIRVVHHIAEALAKGEWVAVFPEGTTSEGREVLPFHANLFQAAIATHTTVQPATIAYVDGQGALVSPHIAYVDDDSMLGSLWRTLKRRSVVARVQVLARSDQPFTNRRACAQWHEQAVRQCLAQLIASKGQAAR
jgi:1-acyl-sn-glycerol-3-phosphate acyltransferase